MLRNWQKYYQKRELSDAGSRGDIVRESAYCHYDTLPSWYIVLSVEEHSLPTCCYYTYRVKNYRNGKLKIADKLKITYVHFSNGYKVHSLSIVSTISKLSGSWSDGSYFPSYPFQPDYIYLRVRNLSVILKQRDRF